MTKSRREIWPVPAQVMRLDPRAGRIDAMLGKAVLRPPLPCMLLAKHEIIRVVERNAARHRLAGNGRKAVTVTDPVCRPSERRWSTTAAAVSAIVPMETTISLASSQRYGSINPYRRPVRACHSSIASSRTSGTASVKARWPIRPFM